MDDEKESKIVVKCRKGYSLSTMGNEIYRIGEGCDMCISPADGCHRPYKHVCEHLIFEEGAE